MSTARADVDPVRADVLGAIAAGGMTGALGRYGLGLLWPHPTGNFPWATLVINLSGSLLIGVLLGELARRPSAHRLWRPLLGVGLLGGYTTFSTFTVDALQLADHGRAGVAVTYVLATVAAGALAVRLGATAVARRQIRSWPEDPEAVP
ncbi:MAG: fluoride efflux transporter CrcB [bacterium]